MVDKEGKYLGIFSRDEALKMAGEKELDLIEIDPKANPPVVKITDFGQFKYEQQKKEKKQKTEKFSETKTVRISPKISRHDLEYKKIQIEKFLTKKRKVKIEIILKGREKAHFDLVSQLLENIIKDLADKGKVSEPPKKQGNKISALINPF